MSSKIKIIFKKVEIIRINEGKSAKGADLALNIAIRDKTGKTQHITSQTPHVKDQSSIEINKELAFDTQQAPLEIVIGGYEKDILSANDYLPRITLEVGPQNNYLIGSHRLHVSSNVGNLVFEFEIVKA